MAKQWRYEKLDENLDLKRINEYSNDTDGSITGQHIINVKAWFDENPEERIRLGWIKHYYLNLEDLKKEVKYNAQTQNLMVSTKQIDDYTVEDEYHVVNKSEEQLAFEELMAMSNLGGSFDFF